MSSNPNADELRRTRNSAAHLRNSGVPEEVVRAAIARETAAADEQQDAATQNFTGTVLNEGDEAQGDSAQLRHYEEQDEDVKPNLPQNEQPPQASESQRQSFPVAEQPQLPERVPKQEDQPVPVPHDNAPSGLIAQHRPSLPSSRNARYHPYGRKTSHAPSASSSEVHMRPRKPSTEARDGPWSRANLPSYGGLTSSSRRPRGSGEGSSRQPYERQPSERKPFERKPYERHRSERQPYERQPFARRSVERQHQDHERQPLSDERTHRRDRSRSRSPPPRRSRAGAAQTDMDQFLSDAARDERRLHDIEQSAAQFAETTSGESRLLHRVAVLWADYPRQAGTPFSAR